MRSVGLYAVACRGCWMPGANEVLGCPRKYFLFIPQNFRRPFFYQLSNFRTTRSLDAPCRAASCPGNDIFLFIFCHLPTFFTQNWPFGYPPGWMPGASHRRTPSTRHWFCPSICLPACMSACMFIYAYTFICLFVCLCLSGCLFCLPTHI